MNPEQPTPAYIWLDAEYTDLDMDRAQLLQVAAIATDTQMNRLTTPDQDLNVRIKLNPGDDVSPWVREHLPDLVAACKTDQALDSAQLDARLKAWILHTTGPVPADKSARPVLAGNSIHADWFLARKFLPEFMSCLHYRLLDVTTLKLLWKDWLGGAKFDKENADEVRRYFPGARADPAGKPHDAYYDVQASIAELNFYRTMMLRTTKA